MVIIKYEPKTVIDRQKILDLLAVHGTSAKLKIGDDGKAVNMRLSTLLDVLTNGDHNAHYPVPRRLRSGVRIHVW